MEPRINCNGETWSLPELDADRSEPVLKMISAFENESGIGFIQCEVFFLRLMEVESFKCHIERGISQEEFFSLPQHKPREPAPPTDDMEMQLQPPPPPPEPMAPPTDDMEMQLQPLPPSRKVMAAPTDDMEMQQQTPNSFEGVSALEFELEITEHGRKEDYNWLKDAYDSIKDNVIRAHAGFTQRTPLGNTILHLAASHGNDVIVEEVAGRARELFTVVNDNYDTALHVAARKGHGSTIKLLLNKFLLFVRSETNGHVEHQSTVDMLLMVSMTLFRNKQGNTFLQEAFMTSSHNGTVIFNAFEERFIEGVSDLFEARFKKIVNGLAVFASNMEGKSLLYLAIEANFKKGVDQLMDSYMEGSDHPLMTTYRAGLPRGKSPLLPALINNNYGMLRNILEKDPDWIHLRNEHGWLPVHHAVLLGYLPGVIYLVEKCPSCTMKRDNNGNLPIQLACTKGHVEIVQVLLEWCLDPEEIVNDLGQNLLHVACRGRHYELVRCLLQDSKLEVMINQKDINGNTPLHLATLSWHPKIVHALTWDNRVNLSVLNNKGLTVLDVAKVGQGKTVTLSQRLTWNALVSAGTPQSSVIVRPNVETHNTTTDTNKDGIDKTSPTTEQFKDRIDTLIVVSTLIITTTFAVGFAFPGDAEQGIPILLNRPMFHFFILSLTISVFGAISSTIILMWARLGDLNLAVLSLKWAIPLLGLSLTSLSLTFLAGMYLIVSKLSWLATTFLVIGVVLILIIGSLYLLLLLPSKSSSPFVRYISYYPFLFFANIAEGKMGSKATIPVL